MGVNFSKLSTTWSVAVLASLGVATALLAKAYKYRAENRKLKELGSMVLSNPQEDIEKPREKPPSPKD